jgi:hypothetical protein
MGTYTTAAAVAANAAVFASTGVKSLVLDTTGPSPKLMKREPHKGENSSNQIQRLWTNPAA